VCEGQQHDWGLIPTHFDQLEPADVALLDRVAAVGAAGGPVPRATEVYRSDARPPVPASLGG
jgi:hypothetical protein